MYQTLLENLDRVSCIVVHIILLQMYQVLENKPAAFYHCVFPILLCHLQCISAIAFCRIGS